MNTKILILQHISVEDPGYIKDLGGKFARILILAPSNSGSVTRNVRWQMLKC